MSTEIFNYQLLIVGISVKKNGISRQIVVY